MIFILVGKRKSYRLSSAGFIVSFQVFDFSFLYL